MKKYRQSWTLQQLQRFIYELRYLLAAGIPMLSALSLIEENYPKQPESQLAKQLQQRICRGMPLAHAWREVTQENLSFALISAGEESGLLAQALSQLEEYAKSTQMLKQILWHAIRYPLFLLILTLALLGLLCNWVIPQFSQLYENFHAKLPSLTQIMLQINQNLQKYFFPGLGVFFVLSLVYWFCHQKLWAKKILIFLKNRITFYQKIDELRFFQVVCLLLKAGIPLLQSLKMAQTSIQNTKLKTYIEMLAREIQRGTSLSTTLKKHPYFSSKLVAIIRLAEASGDLQHMLETYITQQTHLLQLQIQTLKTWLEPVFLCIIGAIVGIVMIALYLPIIEIGRNV
ncbi:MAG: hofC [Gammaproteobacteria bacterium]|jgi:type IV pilus assembly protein PilC|nr:hofC [Gammaproteobacteria bacterium]